MEQIIANFDLLVQIPVINAKIIIDGLLIGGVFALAAYGLALVWGVMNVKNLAQGEFVMVGGYASWFAVGHGVHPLIGIPIAFVLLWGIGWLIYKLVIKYVIELDMFTSLLATFGIAIVIAQLLNILFTSDTQTVYLDYETIFLFDGFVDVPIAKLIGFVCALGLAGAVILFMKKSRMGQAIRATSQNARAARVMGIDTEKVYAFTFSLNAAICGAAGALIVMIWLIQPFYGITYSIRSFVIVTAAGFGNLPGVIAAGLGIGVLEQYGGHILGVGYQQAIAVLLLIGVLVFRIWQQRKNRQVVE